MAKQRVLFSWSGGKDSALCLHRVLTSGRYEVVALLTTVNEHFQRVSMHGVRVELLEAQARQIGLPLEMMFVGVRSSNEEYADRMRAILLKYRALDVHHVVFGDIHLADLRAWREASLAEVGIQGLFPLWEENTAGLLAEFQTLGFRAVICCVDDACLDETHVGVELDACFVKTLPATVDPCGENGEYHSFAFAGPIFRKPLSIEVGETVYRPLEQTPPRANLSIVPDDRLDRPATRGFWFCDLTLSKAIKSAASSDR